MKSRELLIPMAAGVAAAYLSFPVANWTGLPRVVAFIICLILAIILVVVFHGLTEGNKEE